MLNNGKPDQWNYKETPNFSRIQDGLVGSARVWVINYRSSIIGHRSSVISHRSSVIKLVHTSILLPSHMLMNMSVGEIKFKGAAQKKIHSLRLFVRHLSQFFGRLSPIITTFPTVGGCSPQPPVSHAYAHKMITTDPYYTTIL